MARLLYRFGKRRTYLGNLQRQQNGRRRTRRQTAGTRQRGVEIRQYVRHEAAFLRRKRHFRAEGEIHCCSVCYRRIPGIRSLQRPELSASFRGQLQACWQGTCHRQQGGSGSQDRQQAGRSTGCQGKGRLHCHDAGCLDRHRTAEHRGQRSPGSGCRTTRHQGAVAARSERVAGVRRRQRHSQPLAHLYLPDGTRGRTPRTGNALHLAYHSHDGEFLPETCQERQEEGRSRCLHLRTQHRGYLSDSGSRRHSHRRSKHTQRPVYKCRIQHHSLRTLGCVRLLILRMV